MHDLEDFRPRRIHALVDLLVSLDGHDELVLLRVHLAFLGDLAVIAEPAARSAAALQAGVDATLTSAAPLVAVVLRLGERHRPALKSAAPIEHRLATIRPLLARRSRI